MSAGTQSGVGSPQSAGLTNEAKPLASDLVQDAREKALGMVEQQKSAAAEQIEDVARMLDGVAGEIEQSAPVVAPYVREAATQVHRVSSSLRERGIDELLHDVSEFARRRPAAVVGACLIGGFVLARFLKSSADRQAAAQRHPSGSETMARGAETNPRTSSRPQGSSSRISDDRSGATLANTPSPAAGMASLSDDSRLDPDNGPGGTSTAGGGAEAPDQGTVGRI